MTGGPDGTWRILVVDDDDVFRHRLSRAFRDRGHSVTSASSRADARMAGLLGIDAALVDLGLGDESWFDVAKDLLSINASTRIVIMTGMISETSKSEIRRLGLAGLVVKPFDVDLAVDLLR